MTWDGLTPPYATIVVDPPWHYDMVNPPRPPDKHRAEYFGEALSYSSLTLNEISDLPIADLAGDTRCFLWTTNRYLRHAWNVMESWKFQPQTRVFVWCKPAMATLNVTTEFVLMGKHGNPPRMPWHGTTWFNWPRPGGHSTKPAAFFDLVESWCPGPYVELFARQPRLGWDSWGYGFEGVA